MMDTTTMKLLPLLIALVFVPFLSVCTADEDIIVYSEPDPAIRGQLLHLHIFSSEALHNCSLDPNSDVVQIGANEGVSLQGVVLPNARNSFNLSISCTNASTDAEAPPTKIVTEIFVTSDVSVTFDVTTNPSPADEGQNLKANITLRNGGGSPAKAVSCKLQFVPDEGHVSCPGDTCTFPSLRAGKTEVIPVQFDKFPAADVDVKVQCTANNVPEGFNHSFTIFRKADANVVIDPVMISSPVAAGSNFSVDTTIRNSGRAKVDKLLCVFGIEAPSVFVSANDTSCVPTIDKQSNATTDLRCQIGDLQPAGSKALSFVFHTDSGVEEDTKLKFNWLCAAEGLSKNMSLSIDSTTSRVNTLKVVEPSSKTIAGGRDAALFKIKNLGPSDVVNGQCIVTLPKGFTFYQYSQSNDFTCKKLSNASQLDCEIKRLRPEHAQDMDLTLVVPKEANATDPFVISTFCRTSTAVAFTNETFTLVVGSTSSQQPLPPQPVPQDNTMILLVTGIMAVGLLIVIIIWWRRKQDRAGWDATGPAPRSPSLNRFSEMELASRGDD